MNNADAKDKIRMLRHSMTCFTCGLLSFIPVFGFGFGFAALGVSVLASGGERRFWNAARPYRLVGTAAAIIGILFWGIIAVLIVWQMILAANS